MSARGWSRGLGARIAAAAALTAAIGVGIVTLGVLVVGASTFQELMMKLGSTAEAAHAMFDQSVTLVLVVAALGATATAIGVAMILGRWLARPLGELGAAARGIAAGEYARRVEPRGPDEIAQLADAFNDMAASLDEGRRLRDELIGNAAHELRTPLTNLKGYLEGLRDGVVVAEPAAYDSLLEEVDRLVRLAASLETLAGLDAAPAAPPPAPIDLIPVVRGAIDLVRPAAEQGSLVLDIALPERLEARISPDGVAQVVGNLLQNAIRYTPAPGAIGVTARAEGPVVRIEVTNTGPGIPGDDLPHVFERLYRVDKSRDRRTGGAGIGLAIVEQLVTQAGGRVGADSRPGLTRFWFTLPA